MLCRSVSRSEHELHDREASNSAERTALEVLHRTSSALESQLPPRPCRECGPHLDNDGRARTGELCPAAATRGQPARLLFSIPQCGTPRQAIRPASTALGKRLHILLG